MSIQNCGELIRYARTKLKLTQSQLATGICTISTLSRIENGTLNASSSVFDLLMSRMGVSYTTFPYFTNRTDFDCFYALKRARFYLDSWQLTEACQELNFVEKQNWAENMLHYTEWILLYGKLQFLSGCCNHEKNFSFLLSGLQQLNPTLDFLHFQSQLLSKNELEFLILLAEESLALNKIENCITICLQIQTYLEQTRISYLEKNQLFADNAIVMTKYYIFTKQYQNALSMIQTCHLQITTNYHDMQLLRLTFLEGLTLYFNKENNHSLLLLKTALYSAHAIESCYGTICIQYLKNYTNLDISKLFPLSLFPLQSFTEKIHIPPASLSNGIYDNSSKMLTLGQIIRQFREEQQLSQEIICYGLCSKSTLSKIEHSKIQPDIFLMEALLQRLGISERIFSFYGNNEESLFYELKFKSMSAQHACPENLPNYIKELKHVASPKNPLQEQYILMRSEFLEKNPEKGISILFKALSYTLPDFDISRIHEYRLSWAEWNCINNIAHMYLKTETPTKSFYYFYQLMSYMRKVKPDCILYMNTHLRTLEMFCHALYNQKHYKDTFSIFSQKDLQAFKANTNYYSFFLFYYCQIWGECGNYKKAALYGNYAYALSCLNKLTDNATALYQYLKDDFAIIIDIP